VGKTEIARAWRASRARPFLKVEASKFTEVGYVGRDVESMVRELVDVAINMVRSDVKTTSIRRQEARGGGAPARSAAAADARPPDGPTPQPPQGAGSASREPVLDPVRGLGRRAT